MGVLKNDVGRPANKTIKIRFILKAVLLVIVAGGLFLGGYLLNNVSNDKKVDNKNTQEENKDIYARYKEVEFIKNTKLEYYYFDEDTRIDLKIVNGILKGTSIIESTNETKTIAVEGINSKVKYITRFNEEKFTDFETPIAVLTEDDKLYYGSYNKEKTILSFELISSGIKEVVNLWEANSYHTMFYALTTDGDLRMVEYNDYHQKYILTDYLYENRHVYVGNFHDGGYSYQIVINEKDNTLSFIDYERLTDSNIYPGFSAEKYNDEIIKVKYAFISEKDFSMEKPNGWIESYLHIVTEDNEILTTKKPSTQIGNNPNETYEFKLYKTSKVKSVDYAKLGEDWFDTVSITYEDGTTETIKAYYMHETK